MAKEVIQKVEKLDKKHRRKKLWFRVVSCLAGVVVFCTTYALILPAITMERETICGIEDPEHVHTEECYEQSEPEVAAVLNCTPDDVHSHTEECKDADGNIICGYADFVVHKHEDICYNTDGSLICSFPEVIAHTHSEECYESPAQTVSEVQTHVHGDECYIVERGSQICTLEETTGHVHSAECYTVGERTVCGLEEVEAHVHNEECYDEAGALTCKLEQTEGHVHSESCLETTLTCTLEEAEGHQHTDSCFEEKKTLICELVEIPEESEEAKEPQLICTETEIILHTHEEGCFDENGTLTCGLLEVKEHIHDETCSLSRTATFTYSDDQIDATVEVVSKTPIPADTEMVITPLENDSESYIAYADYAAENITGELKGLAAYEITFTSNGEEVLTDAELTVQMEVKEIKEANAGIALMALEEAEESEEEEDTGLQKLTPLQIVDDQVSSGTTGEMDTQSALSITQVLGNTNTFALARTSETINLTIQYYAHIEHFEKLERESNQALWVIDTDNKSENATSGYLPENGQGNDSPVPENTLAYLKMESTGTANEYTVSQEKYVTKVYKDTSEVYQNGMTLEFLDGLRKNEHYYLSHLITQTEEQKKLMEQDIANGTLTALTDNDKYKEDDWAQYIAENGKYWTKYELDVTEVKDTGNEYQIVDGVEIYSGNLQYYLTTNPDAPETDEQGRKRILLTDNMTVRLGYDVSIVDDDYDAAFFDYDISNGTVYVQTSDGYTLGYDSVNSFKAAQGDQKTMLLYTQSNGQALGINSPSNYDTSGSSSVAKLAFGNANTYTGLGHESFTDNGVSVDLNKESGIVNNEYYYSFLGCSYGLVTDYNYATKTLTYGNYNGKQIVAPDLFSVDGTAIGKTTYADSTLTFKREGDTYTLSSATVSDGSGKVGQATGLENFKVRESNSYADVVISNDFWPMDGLIDNDTTGHDFKFQNAESKDNDPELMKSMQVNNNRVTVNDLPVSDDGVDHNNYFGMTFSIDFSLDGNYVGPLEYLFYGDDDMWVFLTDKSTGKSQLVCDIGGVHGSVGSYTDLWDWVGGKGAKGDYALTFFYTERGASGSSCYMEFTIPNAVSEPVKEIESGSLKISKEVADESTEAAYERYYFGIDLPDNYTYPCKIYDSNGRIISTDSLSSTKNTFSLLKDQYIIIDQIPKGSEFTVWETDGEYYEGTWSGTGGQSVTLADGTIGYKGKIEKTGSIVDFKCKNELQGDLTLEKQLDGPANPNTEFKFEIQISDNEEFITGTYPMVKPDGTAGTIEFVSADGNTSKATVTLKDGDAITIQGLPVGAVWKITETDTEGFHVTYTVGEVTTEGTTASGSVIYGDGSSVLFINATSYKLPATGGSGTTSYTIGGLAMIGVAGVLWYKTKRRKEDLASS